VGTSTGRCGASRAAGSVPSEHRVEVDVTDGGDAHGPGHDIRQFQRQRGAVAGAERLCHLSDFFDEPAERTVHAPRAVARAKCVGNLRLQRADIHERITRARTFGTPAGNSWILAWTAPQRESIGLRTLA
jgi:hypothetical protein